MNINREIKQIISINAINLFVFFTCFLGSFTGIFKFFIYGFVLIGYLIYLINKDERIIVMHQLYFLILNEVMLDSLFHYIRIQTPLELKYISEIISLVLIANIIKNRKDYKNLLKNKVLITVLFIIVINIVLCIINKQNFEQLFNALRIYFRFLPVYIVISYKPIDLNKTYKLLYIINLIMFVILSLLGVNRDLRTGIFGIIGASVFSIFVSIKLIDVIIKFINKKVKIGKVVFYSFLSISLFAIAENKAFIGLLGVATIIIILLSKGNLLKKTAVCACIIFIVGAGANILVKMYPHFTYLLSIENFKSNIDDYIFGNSNKVTFSMGRFEAMKYIGGIELDTADKKLLGLGLGTSMPQENLFYMNDSKGQYVMDFSESRIYQKYDPRYGYYLSSLSFIYLDIGILGIILIISLLLVILLKSIYVLRHDNDLAGKTIAASALFIALASIFCWLYGAELINRIYNYIFCIVAGLLSNNYQKIITENKKIRM